MMTIRILNLLIESLKEVGKYLYKIYNICGNHICCHYIYKYLLQTLVLVEYW